MFAFDLLCKISHAGIVVDDSVRCLGRHLRRRPIFGTRKLTSRTEPICWKSVVVDVRRTRLAKHE